MSNRQLSYSNNSSNTLSIRINSRSFALQVHQWFRIPFADTSKSSPFSLFWPLLTPSDSFSAPPHLETPSLSQKTTSDSTQIYSHSSSSDKKTTRRSPLLSSPTLSFSFFFSTSFAPHLSNQTKFLFLQFEFAKASFRSSTEIW